MKDINDVLKYINNSPENTNPAIIKSMVGDSKNEVEIFENRRTKTGETYEYILGSVKGIPGTIQRTEIEYDSTIVSVDKAYISTGEIWFAIYNKPFLTDPSNIRTIIPYLEDGKSTRVEVSFNREISGGALGNYE